MVIKARSVPNNWCDRKANW